MIKSVTIYVRNYNYGSPFISKRIVKVEEKDKVVSGRGGAMTITFTDEWESPHNGDWEDEHIGGYKTFKQARDSLMNDLKRKHKEEIAHVKGLKEDK